MNQLGFSFRRFSLLTLLAVGSCSLALAQSPQEAPRRGGPPGASRPADGGDSMRLPPLVERLLGGNPFRPQSRDMGPLREGEADELLNFARQRIDNAAPSAERIFGWLEEARNRNPQRFESEMQKAAPRLRHLKRLSETSKPLFDAISEHVRNDRQLTRLGREWSRTGPRPLIQQTLRGEIAALVRRNLEIKIDVLGRMIEQATERRDQLITDESARLQSAEASMADGPQRDGGRGERRDALPAELRDAVTKIRESTDPAERERLIGELKTRVAAHIDRAVGFLRERQADLQARLDEETERQTTDVIARAERERAKRPDGGSNDEPASAAPRKLP